MNKDEDWLIAAKLSYVVMGEWLRDSFRMYLKDDNYWIYLKKLCVMYYNNSNKSTNKKIFLEHYVLDKSADDIADRYLKSKERRTVNKKLKRERISFAKWLCQKSPEAAAFKEIQKRLEADILKQIQECA